MSSLPSIVALVGLGAISGWTYTIRQYYLPIKQDSEINREKIRVLEEEIVRLKREMRICGIPIQSQMKDPSSSLPPL